VPVLERQKGQKPSGSCPCSEMVMGPDQLATTERSIHKAFSWKFRRAVSMSSVTLSSFSPASPAALRMSRTVCS